MRIRTCITACAAIGTLALGALPAAASPTQPAAASAVLTVVTDGGSPVAVGDTLTAPLVSGTVASFYETTTGTTGVTCTTSTFTASAVTNPAAPGAATKSLTGQSFNSCSSNIAGVISVQSLTVDHLPYNVSVSDSTGDPVTVTAGTAGPVQATAVLNTWLGQVTCVYRLSGGFGGTADNSTNSLTFTNAPFALNSGSSSCPANSYFSAKYGPVADSSQAGSPKVFVN